ncbi:cation transporter [Pseudogemmatithrix spongiicola]|uniref:cation transporter n=1 Tax=Pseudogemmatithrix spongiicola TaxID=3062599 RepID=UPI003466C922
MFVVELASGWHAESMGLVADGLDMGADAAVYLLALLAMARGGPSPSRVDPFGHRRAGEPQRPAGRCARGAARLRDSRPRHRSGRLRSGVPRRHPHQPAGSCRKSVLICGARRTPPDRLVLDLVGDVPIGCAAVWARPPGWFPLGLAAACFAGYGARALVARRVALGPIKS